MTPLDELSALRQRVAELETAEAQHKQVEGVSRKSAEEIKDLYNKAPCGYHSLDKNGAFVRINETELAWLGYTRDEIIGKKFPEITTSESRKTFQATFPILRQRGWVKDLELELVRKDGSVMPVLISATAILNEKGDFLMSRSTMYDITERKQAGEKLRLRESFLSAITENQPGLLWLKDAEGRFLMVNKAFATACGRGDPEHVRSLTDMDIWPKELADKYRNDDRRVMSTDNSIMVEEMIFIGNNHVWYETFKTPVHDDKDRVIGTTGFARDITERKRAEEALRESERRYRLLFEGITDGVFVHDITNSGMPGRFLAVNDTICQRLGYTRAELLCMTVSDIDAPESTVDRLKITERLKRDKKVLFQQTHMAKDGHRIPVEINAQIFQMQDRPVILSVIRDITERKQAEEERYKLEAQMQQSQRLESLGVLAGGIAHDFNNLLTVILGHANLASADLPPESPTRENLLEIDNASRRAAELCRQMLAYSGRGSFVMKPLNLSRLVQELIHMLQVSISKKAMLRCDFEKNLPSIEADPAQVRQVVMNLVINASEATGSKEGIISISTGSMQCDQAYLRESHPKPPPPGKYVYIEVSDTGCGMDSKTLAKIFDPFFTTKFTGRGLGLAAVIGIMRQHKGAIKITTEPGKGSTFRVLFSASSNTETHPEAGTSPKLWRGSGTILVVDDEAEVLNVVKIMLEHHGFHVLAATDGREAMELFQKHGGNIVCVLLDMTMPHMDGAETYRELRRIHGDVPVILASGYSEQEIAKHFMGQDPPEFIEKPFEASKLMTKLHNALDKAKTSNHQK